MDTFLSRDEIIQLTGKRTTASQCSVLNGMGVRYKQRPDGFPVVLRQHIQHEFGGMESTVKESKRAQPNWSMVNA